jgi:hypothetical protein
LSIAYGYGVRFLGLVMICVQIVRWRIGWRGFSCQLVVFMSRWPRLT